MCTPEKGPLYHHASCGVIPKALGCSVVFDRGRPAVLLFTTSKLFGGAVLPVLRGTVVILGSPVRVSGLSGAPFLEKVPVRVSKVGRVSARVSEFGRVSARVSVFARVSARVSIFARVSVRVSVVMRVSARVSARVSFFARVSVV